jgi:hypothetical protein
MVAAYRELLEMKIRLIGKARFELTTSSSSTAPLLTRQVLPLEGARLLGRQPPCTTATDQTHALTTTVEFLISRSISKGGGDSRAR